MYIIYPDIYVWVLWQMMILLPAAAEQRELHSTGTLLFVGVVGPVCYLIPKIEKMDKGVGGGRTGVNRRQSFNMVFLGQGPRLLTDICRKGSIGVVSFVYEFTCIEYDCVQNMTIFRTMLEMMRMGRVEW